MAKALTAARAGFRRLFSISAFTPPPPATVPPPAEPSTNLFVSGLSKRTTSEGLREAFSKFGNLMHARVVTDRVSGYSKGFGFVRYATVEEAAEGIKGMDGKFLDGWVIFAEYAKPRPVESSQSLQNTTSAPPPNYTSQTPQSWSSYRPSPPSEPPSSYSSYNQSSDPPSNYSSYSQSSNPPPSYSSYSQSSNPPPSYSSYMPPTSEPPPSNSSYTPPSNYNHNSPQTPQNNSSVPPPNYSPPSSPPSSRFVSVQSTNYSQSSEFQQGNAWAPPSWNPSASQPPNYAPSSYASAQTFNHSPQASHPAYSPMHGTSEHVSSYASAPPNDSPQNSAVNSDNQTSEPSYNFDSGRAAQY